MTVTNLKLHHDWRKDLAGTHMRRVGNNWRITLHMRYKKARREVLECMVLCGLVNLVVSLIYRPRCKRGCMAESETVMELYSKLMLPI